jgi:hypothetical protein
MYLANTATTAAILLSCSAIIDEGIERKVCRLAFEISGYFETPNSL